MTARLKLGLLAVRRLIDLVGGGCGLVVADIRPLNPSSHGDLGVPAAGLLGVMACNCSCTSGVCTMKRLFSSGL